MSKGENMVEVVAQTIASGVANDHPSEHIARLVLATLMEPTPEMCQAVYNMTGGHYVVGDFPPIWQTALRTILSQPNDSNQLD